MLQHFLLPARKKGKKRKKKEGKRKKKGERKRGEVIFQWHPFS
jgi:hypothetical protein